MTNKPIEEQLKAAQLQYLEYTTVKPDSADSWAPQSSTPMRFTPERPRPPLSPEITPEKNDFYDPMVDTMLKYILQNHTELYNNLTPKGKNLLPIYIEAERLGLKQNFTDLTEEIHTMLQLVRKASEACLPKEHKPKFP